MGDCQNGDLRVGFDRRLKLKFLGSQVTSDAGLLAYRELDAALGLTEMASELLADSRQGSNKQHQLVPLLRQSIYSRLSSYEDVNDAERLSVDPAIRHVVGGRAALPEKHANSTSEVGRFETEMLSTQSDLAALINLSGQWIDKVHVTPSRFQYHRHRRCAKIRCNHSISHATDASMTIPAVKVKSICTKEEIALVRASRAPELEQLSAVEVKRLAVRARELFNKWQALSRKQSRQSGRQTGASEVDKNTRMKVEIFREARATLEARLEKIGAAVAAGATPVPTPRHKTKVDRNAEHRVTRAAVRKGMTAVEDLLNAGRKRAKPASEPKIAAGAKAKGKKTSKARAKRAKAKPQTPVALAKLDLAFITSHGAKKGTAPGKIANLAAPVSPAKQRAATTAARQSRVVRSGKTTRMLGHMVSQGKRSQARRDAKN